VYRGAAIPPRPQLGIHPNITSFGQDGRGEIYITVQTGEVYRIVRQ